MSPARMWMSRSCGFIGFFQDSVLGMAFLSCLAERTAQLEGPEHVFGEHHSIPFPNIPNTTFFRLFDLFGSCIVAIPRYSVFILFHPFIFEIFLWIAFRFRQIPHFLKISPSYKSINSTICPAGRLGSATNSVISRQLNTEVALLDWDVAGKDALCMCPRTV